MSMKTIFYRHNKSGTAPAVEKSVISFFDLTFVLSGSLFYYINGERIDIRANEGILIPLGALRERESSAAEYISFNFTETEVLDIPLHFYEIPYESKLLFRICDELQKNYSSYEQKISPALEMILDSLRENNKKRSELPVVGQIKKYIREHLAEKITLEKISVFTGYTPNYCDHLFRKETGVSIIRYVIAERIVEAKRLLTEGALSLTDISFSVGFEDYNYFSRVFKKHEGVSPSAFRIS